MSLAFGNTKPIIEGTIVRFYTLKPFQDTTQTVSDPAKVVFAFNVGNQVTVECEYISGTTTGPFEIVRDSVGTYHVDVDTTGYAGRWTATWASSGGNVQTKDEIQLVIVPANVSVTF